MTQATTSHNKPHVDTRITLILDRSGSMEPVKEATIQGINSYIKELQQSTDRYTLTLVQFSTGRLQHTFISKPLKDIEPLTAKDYQPGGGTALYDAVVPTLKALKSGSSTSKNLVVILTDGEENSSSEYSEKDFRGLVEDLSAKKNFEFVYLGANQDAWDNASNWGFKKDNVSSFNTTSRGMGATFQAMSMSTQAYTSASTAGAYFTAQQKKDLKDTK